VGGTGDDPVGRRFAETPGREPVPQYGQSTAATSRARWKAVRDRQGPVTGGLGSHLMLTLSDGTLIEVRLALTKFVTQ